jgi:hypothetical protein
VAGQDVASLSSTDPSDAIDVPWDASLAGSGTAPGVYHYKVLLEFAGFRWKVGEGDASNNTWSHSVEPKNYAIYGTGLYRVIGQAEADVNCEGAALVRLVGKNPLTTVLGTLGVFVCALGAFGTLVSVARSGGKLRAAKKYPVNPGALQDTVAGITTPGQWVSCVLRASPIASPTVFRDICRLGSDSRNRIMDVCKWRVK